MTSTAVSVVALLPVFTSAFMVPAVRPQLSMLKVAMSSGEATRDSAPKVGQSWDNGMSGWKPPSGGGDAHGGAGFQSTDTPDFMPEEGTDASRKMGGVGFTDGMMGSQNDGSKQNRAGPELQGALDSNPDIYVPEVEEIAVNRDDFVLPSSGMTDLDFEMFVSSTETKDLTIDVRPVAMTFEDYYCGFTADSHPAFSVSPSSGTMERRNGPPTQVTVTVNPQGKSGDLVGYLCFILPEERAFSTFYKITCASR